MNILVLVLAGLVFGVLVYMYASGGFRNCPECGSICTTLHTGETPDASLGQKEMHQYEYLECHWCGYNERVFTEVEEHFRSLTTR